VLAGSRLLPPERGDRRLENDSGFTAPHPTLGAATTPRNLFRYSQ
jgi:hypothetical protein